MSESFERICGLKKISTVTIHFYVIVVKLDFTSQNLSLRVEELVITKLVGMNEMDNLIGLLSWPFFIGKRKDISLDQEEKNSCPN